MAVSGTLAERKDVNRAGDTAWAPSCSAGLCGGRTRSKNRRRGTGTIRKWSQSPRRQDPRQGRMACSLAVIASTGRVFTTSWAVTPPLRATFTPKGTSANPSVLWASGLMLNFTPFSLA